MQPSTMSGLALALMLAGGLAACNGTGDNAAVPPADEPAQTGSLPADPAAPPPLAEPDPMANPPAGEDAY